MMAVRGFVIALLPDFSRVDDVVQETFLTATAKAKNFEPGTNFKAWVFTIARFKVLESHRDLACGRVAFTPEVIEALSAEDHDEALQEEHLQLLARCVEKLSPQAKRAVQLRYHQAHRPPEIARAMGWTLNAVNVALARARVALRECMELALKKDFA